MSDEGNPGFVPHGPGEISLALVDLALVQMRLSTFLIGVQRDVMTVSLGNKVSPEEIQDRLKIIDSIYQQASSLAERLIEGRKLKP